MRVLPLKRPPARNGFLLKSLSFVTAFALSLPAPLPAQVPREPAAAFPAMLAKDFTSIGLPEEMGAAVDIHNAGSSRIVILIQDAHSIPDAQRNIRRIIDFFQKKYGIGIVGFEGSDAELNPRVLKSFPVEEELKAVLQRYEERGELSGVTGAALLNETDSVYKGLEDWKLYLKGTGLFLTAMKKEKGILRDLSGLASELAKEKELYYSPELYRIDLALENFEAEKADLLSTLKVLASSLPPEPGSDIAHVLEASAGEKAADAALEMEVRRSSSYLRTRLETSAPALELNAVLKELNSKEQEFLTSQMNAGAFGAVLADLAGRAGIELKFSTRAGHASKIHKKVRELKGTRFFRDFEAYASAVKERLFRNAQERRLDAQGAQLRLLRKLAKLEVSPAEWSEIEDLVKAEDVRKILPENIIGSTSLSELASRMTEHLDFYAAARARDDVFLRNMTSLMEERRADSLIMVAGGFHTDALSSLLKMKGLSHITITPAISGIPEEPLYRMHMEGNVSWKDYLVSENGTVNFYDAFIRGTRERLLEAAKEPAGRMLKLWRDEIIRCLSREGLVARAKDHTRFIDELARQKSAADGANVHPQWSENIARFIERLEGLSESGGPDRESFLALFRKGTSAEAVLVNALAEGVLAPRVLVPAARSELRREAFEEISAAAARESPRAASGEAASAADKKRPVSLPFPELIREAETKGNLLDRTGNSVRQQARLDHIEQTLGVISPAAEIASDLEALSLRLLRELGLDPAGYVTVLADSEEANAMIYTNSKVIQFNWGLLEFLRGKNALDMSTIAFILGHEVGHAVAREKQQTDRDFRPSKLAEEYFADEHGEVANDRLGQSPAAGVRVMQALRRDKSEAVITVTHPHSHRREYKIYNDIRYGFWSNLDAEPEPVPPEKLETPRSARLGFDIGLYGSLAMKNLTAMIGKASSPHDMLKLVHLYNILLDYETALAEFREPSGAGLSSPNGWNKYRLENLLKAWERDGLTSETLKDTARWPLGRRFLHDNPDIDFELYFKPEQIQAIENFAAAKGLNAAELLLHALSGELEAAVTAMGTARYALRGTQQNLSPYGLETPSESYVQPDTFSPNANAVWSRKASIHQARFGDLKEKLMEQILKAGGVPGLESLTEADRNRVIEHVFLGGLSYLGQTEFSEYPVSHFEGLSWDNPAAAARAILLNFNRFSNEFVEMRKNGTNWMKGIHELEHKMSGHKWGGDGARIHYLDAIFKKTLEQIASDPAVAPEMLLELYSLFTEKAGVIPQQHGSGMSNDILYDDLILKLLLEREKDLGRLKGFLAGMGSHAPTGFDAAKFVAGWLKDAPSFREMTDLLRFALGQPALKEAALRSLSAFGKQAEEMNALPEEIIAAIDDALAANGIDPRKAESRFDDKAWQNELIRLYASLIPKIRKNGKYGGYDEEGNLRRLVEQYGRLNHRHAHITWNAVNGGMMWLPDISRFGAHNALSEAIDGLLGSSRAPLDKLAFLLKNGVAPDSRHWEAVGQPSFEKTTVVRTENPNYDPGAKRRGPMWDDDDAPYGGPNIYDKEIVTYKHETVVRSAAEIKEEQETYFALLLASEQKFLDNGMAPEDFNHLVSLLSWRWFTPKQKFRLAELEPLVDRLRTAPYNAGFFQNLWTGGRIESALDTEDLRVFGKLTLLFRPSVGIPYLSLDVEKYEDFLKPDNQARQNHAFFSRGYQPLWARAQDDPKANLGIAAARSVFDAWRQQNPAADVKEITDTALRLFPEATAFRNALLIDFAGDPYTAPTADLEILRPHLKDDTIKDVIAKRIVTERKERFERTNPGEVWLKDYAAVRAMIGEYFPPGSRIGEELMNEWLQEAEIGFEELRERSGRKAADELARDKKRGTTHMILERITDDLENRSPSDKKEIFEWLTGMRQDKPAIIQFYEHSLKVNLSTLRDSLAYGPKADVYGMTALLFAGPQGVLSEQTAAAQLMKDLFAWTTGEAADESNRLYVIFEAVFQSSPEAKQVDLLSGLLGHFISGKAARGASGKDAVITQFLTSFGLAGIKLGQVLGFQSLSDRVEPLDKRYLMSALLHDGPALEVLQQIESIGKLLGSASIKQSYIVTMKDGRTLALKYVRPLARAEVKDNLAILDRTLERLRSKIPELDETLSPSLIEEIKKAVLRELDIGIEMQSQKEIGGFVNKHTDKGDWQMRVPAVDPLLNGRHFFADEFVENGKPPKTQYAAELGSAWGEISSVALRSFLRQALIFGKYHADLHRGNMLLQETLKKNNLIDFGNTAELNKNDQEAFILLLAALSSRNSRLGLFQIEKRFAAEGRISPEDRSRFKKIIEGRQSPGEKLREVKVLFERRKIPLNPRLDVFLKVLDSTSWLREGREEAFAGIVTEVILEWQFTTNSLFSQTALSLGLAAVRGFFMRSELRTEQAEAPRQAVNREPAAQKRAASNALLQAGADSGPNRSAFTTQEAAENTVDLLNPARPEAPDGPVLESLFETFAADGKAYLSALRESAAARGLLLSRENTAELPVDLEGFSSAAREESKILLDYVSSNAPRGSITVGIRIDTSGRPGFLSQFVQVLGKQGQKAEVAADSSVFRQLQGSEAEILRRPLAGRDWAKGFVPHGENIDVPVASDDATKALGEMFAPIALEWEGVENTLVKDYGELVFAASLIEMAKIFASEDYKKQRQAFKQKPGLLAEYLRQRLFVQLEKAGEIQAMFEIRNGRLTLVGKLVTKFLADRQVKTSA